MFILYSLLNVYVLIQRMISSNTKIYSAFGSALSLLAMSDKRRRFPTSIRAWRVMIHHKKKNFASNPTMTYLTSLSLANLLTIVSGISYKSFWEERITLIVPKMLLPEGTPPKNLRAAYMCWKWSENRWILSNWDLHWAGCHGSTLRTRTLYDI